MIKNFILFSATVLFCCVMLELVLRAIFPPPVVWKYPQESYRYDSQIGHWLESSQSAYTHDKIVRTNSEGLRDREYELHASDATERILALGDSQTFGNGLLSENTWPKQLESTLNDAGLDKRYEVINAGLPSSDTWQHEIILERMLARYSPDMVVLAFYTNDVVKRFTPTPVAKIEHDPIYSKLVFFLKKSVLLLNLRVAVDTIINMVNPPSGFLSQQALLKGEERPELEERWKQVSDSIVSMKRLLEASNTEFLIFALPRRDQVDGRLPWKGYYGELSKIAEENEIPLYSMLEPLRDAYKEHGKQLFIPWDGHNSDIANGVIAETLRDVLTDSGN